MPLDGRRASVLIDPSLGLPTVQLVVAEANTFRVGCPGANVQLTEQVGFWLICRSGCLHEEGLLSADAS